MRRADVLFAACAVVLGASAIFDSRVLPNGENTWLKPLRFAIAFAVHAFTLDVLRRLCRRDEARDLWFALGRRGQIWAMVVELACIAMQGARGVPSHFNTSTAFDAAIFTVMGLGTLAFFAGYAAMAWSLIRRPGPSRLIDVATIAGLVLSIAGGLVGVAMVSVFGGHGIGEGGGSLPLFGWRVAGGDLRVPHFVGIHALQALPALAWLAERYLRRGRGAVLAVGSAAYLLLFAGVVHLTLAGRSLSDVFA
ncbi:MAG: hypothetical protein FJX20_03335 [Alphaproteobacteria bacterium]|nr:hypothetical protein [Alphaproteobacteria bacterium]